MACTPKVEEGKTARSPSSGQGSDEYRRLWLLHTAIPQTHSQWSQADYWLGLASVSPYPDRH